MVFGVVCGLALHDLGGQHCAGEAVGGHYVFSS